MSRLLKVALLVVVALIAWKYVGPRLHDSSTTLSSSTSTTGAADSSCVTKARQASEKWGSGLGRFVNPPYDLDAWSTFRGDVEAKIGAAESECSCAAESCQSVRGAMHDLRGLVADLDTSIRNGSPVPTDVVQRQESVDNAIDAARESARAGK